MLSIRYLGKIRHELLYRTTNQRTQTVKKQRLRFFGHMAKFPDDASVKLALNEFRNTKAKNFKRWPKAGLALAN